MTSLGTPVSTSDNPEAASDSTRSMGKKSGKSKNQPKMVWHHPMPVPGGYGSPYFEGKEVTEFLKTLNRCFKDYGINDNKEKKERIAEYVAKRFRKDIKRLPEYRDSTS